MRATWMVLFGLLLWGRVGAEEPREASQVPAECATACNASDAAPRDEKKKDACATCKLGALSTLGSPSRPVAKAKTVDLALGVTETGKGHAADPVSGAKSDPGADPMRLLRCDRACKRAVPERCVHAAEYEPLLRACHVECATASAKLGTSGRLARYSCASDKLEADGDASIEALTPAPAHGLGGTTSKPVPVRKHKRNAWDTN